MLARFRSAPSVREVVDLTEDDDGLPYNTSESSLSDDMMPMRGMLPWQRVASAPKFVG
jgi:hypothetical protein